MKNRFYYIVVFFLTSFFVNAQTAIPTTVVKGVGYSGITNDQLVASQKITLGPGVHIQAGSSFSAKIVSNAFTGTDFNSTVGPTALQGENYIYTRKFNTPMTTPAGITKNSDVTESITYFDGLGRPKQQIAIKASANDQDIVTHIEYDGFGRQIKDYLPYPASQNTGVYIDGFSTAQPNILSYYQSKYGDANPFSEKLLENSPLNRVLKQAAPGNDWAMNAGHEIKLDYQTNTATEVKNFGVSLVLGNNTYTPTIVANGNYAANQLYKTITKDENWTSGTNNTTEEFKDKEGRVLLKRTYNATNPHDTYYIYDNYGNLTYVLPPSAEGNYTPTILDGLCYQYKYDHRNRLVEKKLPGKQWEFIVYDKLDRVIATGPAFSPFSDNAGTAGWMITKYDVFNRPVYTGWYASSATSIARETWQNAQNIQTTALSENKTSSGNIDSIPVNYSNAVAPTSLKLLTVNYYDDYLFPHAESIPGTAAGQAVYYNNSRKPQGIPTASWTRILETTILNNAEKSIIYYDEKSRAIRTKLLNHLGGYAQTDTAFDFAGKTLYTETRHKRTNANAELLIREEYTYSNQGRLLAQTHQINGGSKEFLAQNTYDDLGQLKVKNVGGSGSNGLQKIDYTYNIRGWLKEINKYDNLLIDPGVSDLFAFKINYNDNATTALQGETVVSRLYNGNISETFWTVAGGKKQKYGYLYDNLNRLGSAIYQDPGNVIVTNAYNESLTYDKNGNIQTLVRNDVAPIPQNSTQIDNLVYTYKTNSPNQLLRVIDNSPNNKGFKDVSGDDYTYDDNGNMTLDNNKGITTPIQYNHLNLPTKIVFPTGNITYIYNALGQKVSKIVVETGKPIETTDYLGGFQYKNTGLLFFPTAEGYVNNTAGVYNYVYNYTDHLGNVRLSYTQQSGVLKILEENNYYPFGLKHEASGANNYQKDYKYKYNGKELQDELGLNVYDYGFRLYDPAIGRMQNPDPLAELAYDLTPNRYCFNNPVNFIDPSGLWETTANGYKTDKPEDIKRFMSYMDTEKNALNNTPTTGQTSTFIEGEMSAGGHGKTSDGNVLADELSITTYNQIGGGSKGYADEKSFSNFWHGVQKSLTPDGLDTRTIGQQFGGLGGLTYSGPSNPKTYAGNDDYSFAPNRPEDVPGMIHDLTYDRLGITGAGGLFTAKKAIGADFKFVTQELAIAFSPYSFSIRSRVTAGAVGIGLGAAAVPKTIYTFSEYLVQHCYSMQPNASGH